MNTKTFLGLISILFFALSGGCTVSANTPTLQPAPPPATNTPAIEYPSNIADMPVVGADHYDNPVIYPASNPTHPAVQSVEAITEQAVANGVPGVVMLISTPEDGLWVSAKGYIDLKNNILLKPNSLSRIGSITKMFTAVVIHQLAQEGKLSLDDPVSKYLPETLTHGIANADQATIRQLLGHTSGIVNYTDYFDIPALYKSGTNKDLTTLSALELVSGLPPTFAPGTGAKYSNTNYILLGFIAEAVTGQPIKELYQERIFTPLGLQSTYYDPDLPVQRGVARGYLDFPAGNLIDSTEFDQAARTPDGGIVSNVYDMATFIQALIQDKRLLSETEYAAMTDDFHLDDRLGCCAGYGILRATLSNGEFAYGHSGGHFGYTAELWYVPTQKLSIAYLVNGSSQFGTHVKPIQELRASAFSLLADYLEP